MSGRTDPVILREIWEIIEERAETRPAGSYVASVLGHRKGMDKALEKLGEESVEYIIAAKNGVEEQTIEEAADLLFHFLLALKASEIPLDAVLDALAERRAGDQK